VILNQQLLLLAKDASCLHYVERLNLVVQNTAAHNNLTATAGHKIYRQAGGAMSSKRNTLLVNTAANM
jgi:hypothetical protein